MFDKLKQYGDLKKMRDQALQIQKQLAQEQIIVEEGDIRVVISGDQRLLEFSVKEHSSDLAIEVLNKAIKQSQELAAKKLQEMSGGLGGLLGGGSTGS